ncbi:iron chelate uptake ABC transporter family permease subunit [Streptomyces noursei]|uniref:iron chelate uptake ABC transporter family permease subunit n=1 Tax=Streptomyces noursei TaxID=1971 RepID=UPI0035D6B546
MLCAGGAGSRGYRVLVVGIGVSTFLGAVGDLVMSRQNDNTAGGVFLRAVGSLNGRDATAGTPLLVALAFLVPLCLAAGTRRWRPPAPGRWPPNAMTRSPAATANAAGSPSC